MEHFCNVHCQLEGGIVFPFFQVHNGFAPDADQLGKVCLLKAPLLPGILSVWLIRPCSKPFLIHKIEDDRAHHRNQNQCGHQAITDDFCGKNHTADSAGKANHNKSCHADF